MREIYYNRNESSLIREKYEASSKQILDSNDELEKKVVAQIEVFRRQRKITVTDFAELLGLNRVAYYKLISQNRKLDTQTFFTFCRLFRFDIATITGESWLDSQNSMLRELAVLLGQLSPDTLKDISSVIANSQEQTQIKERGTKLLSSLSDLVQQEDYKPYTLFANDDGTYPNG